MNIHQLIDQFIADACAGKTNETPGAYRSKLKRLSTFMEERKLKPKSLRPEHVSEFRNQLLGQNTKRRGSQIISGHLSPFTINTVLRTVKHFLRWAHVHQYLKRDLSQFRINPPPLPDPKAVTEENVTRLLDAAARLGQDWEQARNLTLLYLLRDTGGRIGALLNIDIDNLDLKAGKLFTRTKGDKMITLYMNEPTIEILRVWLELRPALNPTDRKLFTSAQGGGLTRGGFYSLLGRLIETAGLRGLGRVNAHSFRHAWARDALTAGEDLTRVSQTLGHTSVRVTGDYYARWTDGELKNAHVQYSPGAKLPRPGKKNNKV